MTGSAARRRELGRCLRSYRDLLGPERVGLPATGRRRAPGLRREEVAQLAGVGVTWYTWLEQGRVTASERVLDAVGRVFGIDDVGREHLRLLSRPADAAPPVSPHALRPLLDSWPSDPAVLLDARMDVVAANAAWRHVWGPPGDHVLTRLAAGAAWPGPERSGAGWSGGALSVDGGAAAGGVAARPGASGRTGVLESGAPGGRVGDPSALVRALARRFRMLTHLAPTDARLARIAQQVRAAAPGLGPVWDCRGVGAFGRPGIRVDGVDRVAYLVGDAGAPDPTAPAVLVLLRS